MEYLKISEIKINPANPRIIRDERYRKLVRSIAQFPKMLDVRGIVVDGTRTIMGGNQRYRAICDILKMPDSELADLLAEHPESLARWERIRDKKGHIPANWVLHADNFTPDELRRFIIADNVEFGEHDWDALAKEWDAEALGDWGVEVPGLDEEGAGGKETQEDDYEIPKEIETDIVHGDLFEIGPHRLLCGDSTIEDTFKILMPTQLAAAVVTDPPYGVDYVGKTKSKLVVHNDGAETLLPLIQSALSISFSKSLPGAIWYVAAPPGPQFFDFATVLRGLEVWRQTIVWVKQSLVLGHSDYHYQHECIFYGWKPGGVRKQPPDRKQTTVWNFDRPTKSVEHPTMKPVGLFAKMMENSTSVGSEVLDPFLGSGTTMVAAHQLGRRCYGIELSPKYCQVIVDRMIALDPSIEIKRNGQPYARIAQNNVVKTS